MGMSMRLVNPFTWLKQKIKNRRKIDINTFRKWNLAYAEAIDAWRIIPRLMVTAYAYLCYVLVNWFLHYDKFEKVECNDLLMRTLLDHKIPIDVAKDLACKVTEVTGPTTAEITFVTAVVGLATGIFGLYASSGKDWSKSIMPWSFGTAREEKESAVRPLMEAEETSQESDKPTNG